MSVKRSIWMLTCLIYVSSKYLIVSSRSITYIVPEVYVPDLSSSLIENSTCPFRIIRENNITEVVCLAKSCEGKCNKSYEESRCVQVVMKNTYHRIACICELSNIKEKDVNAVGTNK